MKFRATLISPIIKGKPNVITPQPNHYSNLMSSIDNWVELTKAQYPEGEILIEELTYVRTGMVKWSPDSKQ